MYAYSDACPAGCGRCPICGHYWDDHDGDPSTEFTCPQRTNEALIAAYDAAEAGSILPVTEAEMEVLRKEIKRRQRNQGFPNV